MSEIEEVLKEIAQHQLRWLGDSVELFFAQRAVNEFEKKIESSKQALNHCYEDLKPHLVKAEQVSHEELLARVSDYFPEEVKKIIALVKLRSEVAHGQD